jgi:hypothetical protein
MISPSVLADDFFDNYMGIDRAWDGQKPITDKEFEEAVKVLEGNKKQKEAKANKKKIKKLSGGGTSLHSALSPEKELASQSSLKQIGENSGQLLNIPVSIVVGNKVLEPGYYNVYGERNKTDNSLLLSFYQAHSFMGDIPAFETDEDCDADDVNFVKLIPYNENYVKVIYGSLDFNAFAYIQYYNN